MAKPIVLMFLPRHYSLWEGSHFRNEDVCVELMRMLNGNFGEEPPNHKIIYPVYWTDYYWLVFPKDDINEPELQVFYEKDFTPINFDELKKFIDNSLNSKEVQP